MSNHPINYLRIVRLTLTTFAIRTYEKGNDIGAKLHFRANANNIIKK